MPTYCANTMFEVQTLGGQTSAIGRQALMSIEDAQMCDHLLN